MVLFKFGFRPPWRTAPVRLRVQVVRDTLQAFDLAVVAAGLENAAVGVEADADHDGQALRNGPGWFTSSWDLCRGLDVVEACADNGPLDEWSTVVFNHRFEPFGRRVVARPERTARHATPDSTLVLPGLSLESGPDAFGNRLELDDLDLAVAGEITQLDQFGRFGIEDLKLV